MKLAFAAILLASAAAAECPPVADTSAAQARLLAELRVAPDEGTARRLSQRLWQIWATAPDAEAQSMLNRGMARREMYDFEGAASEFDALVVYCPDYAEGYNQRAFVNFLRADYGAALKDLDLALERSPRHVAALSGKALTLMGLGRMDEAQQVLRAALALNPWLPERAYLIEEPGEEL